MFYRNSGITGKTLVELSTTIKTMSDISIVMTLSTLPTKRCGLYSITQQRTLGMDSNGHLCYWFYDGKNDRCLNGSTILSGTNVKVGAIHSRNGVRLYVNGILDAFCEAPLWSEGCNLSYIGTHGLAPSDLEMDGTISGVLLVDYAMTDEEMSAVNWDSELYVVNNHLYYAPSKTTLHLDGDTALTLNGGSVYALEDNGSIAISNEEKLPCWYLGEYNSTTQDVTLNISDKRGGGTYNRMEVDHLVVHDIDVADTTHTVEADGDDVYPYLAINEYNNAIFTNPHISTMKVEYHCTASVVSNPNTITVWGSSYDDTFPYIYAKYTITYKDGASGTIITVVRDPSHQQYMVRTVTCYVESTSSTYTWPTDPTQFASGTTLSFYGRNAHAGKYQFTRQWTWFGIDWYASSHSDRPNASVVTGFTSGHWVSGSETAIFVVDDDYLRNIVVVEDVVSQSVKDYATSQSQPVSSYMGKKMLPSGISGGYALSDSNGSLQAKDCYLEEVHADGFRTTSALSSEAYHNVTINNTTDLYRMVSLLGDGSCLRGMYRVEGRLAQGYVSYTRELFDKWNNHSDPPMFYSDYFHSVGVKNWFMGEQYVASYHFRRFLLSMNDTSSSWNMSEINSELYTRLGIEFPYGGNTYRVYTGNAKWKQGEFVVTSGDLVGLKYKGLTVVKNGSICDLEVQAIVRAQSSMDTLKIEFIGSSQLSTITLTCQNLTVYPYLNYGNSGGYTPFGVMKVPNRSYPYTSYEVGFDGYLSNGEFYGKMEDIYIQTACDAYFEGGVGNGTQYINIGYKNPNNFVKYTYNMGGNIIPDTISSLFPMVIQSWTIIRGESYMRALLPFDSSDSYVAQNGSTIGSSDHLWESIFVNSIRDANSVLLRPFKATDTQQTTMLLYDKYMMVWGTNTTNGSGVSNVYLEKSFSDSNYVVVSTMNVVTKNANSIQFNGTANRAFGWIAIGKRYI